MFKINSFLKIKIMQIQPIDSLTTLVYDKPPFSIRELDALPNSLYFCLNLKFEGANFDGEQRRNLKRCLRAAVQVFGGNSKAVGFDGEGINLLIALPTQTILEDFIERLRIFSKSFVRRKLNAKNFVWNDEYEVSTVGFAQIELLCRAIRNQDQLTAVAAPKLVALETID